MGYRLLQKLVTLNDQAWAA